MSQLPRNANNPLSYFTPAILKYLYDVKHGAIPHDLLDPILLKSNDELKPLECDLRKIIPDVISYEINKEQEISGVFLGIDDKLVLGVGYFCSILIESDLDSDIIHKLDQLTKKYKCTYGIEAPFVYIFI
jgi:hypothetical protein